MCRQSNVAGYEYKYLLLIKFSSSPDVGCRPYKMLRCQKPLSPSWLNSSVSLKKTVESIISQLNVSHLSSLVDRLVQKKAITSLGSKRQTRAKSVTSAVLWGGATRTPHLSLLCSLRRQLRFDTTDVSQLSAALLLISRCWKSLWKPRLFARGGPECLERLVRGRNKKVNFATTAVDVLFYDSIRAILRI